MYEAKGLDGNTYVAGDKLTIRHELAQIVQETHSTRTGAYLVYLDESGEPLDV